MAKLLTGLEFEGTNAYLVFRTGLVLLIRSIVE